LLQIAFWPVAAAFVVLFVVACIAFDLRVRRIPNLLTGSTIVAGFVTNVLFFGFAGILPSFAGIAVTLAVLVVPFALGGIGGGDVKMMAAIGAFIGPRLALESLVVGVILGGMVVVVHLFRLGRLREKLLHLKSMLLGAFLTRSPEPLKISAEEPGAVALPYSVPLGLGTLAVLALTLR